VGSNEEKRKWGYVMKNMREYLVQRPMLVFGLYLAYLRFMRKRCLVRESVNSDEERQKLRKRGWCEDWTEPLRVCT